MNKIKLKNYINLFVNEIIFEEIVRKKYNINLPKDLENLSNIFKKNNKQFYLVGGSVRDALMKKDPKDFDLATDASPEQIINILNSYPEYKILELGKAFGVIKVITPEKNEYEIATFRKDIGSGRRPDSVEFSKIEQDVLRRDLTINALYYDIENKEIVDYIGGIKDIEDGVIKTVGEPSERFNEDRLRILRVLRFAARMDKKIDLGTANAIKNDNLLTGVSGERIRDEFIKGIKSSKSVVYFFDLITEFDLWDQIFPNLIINFDFKETKNIPVILSILLKNNVDSKKLSKILNLLKYSVDEVSQISFLNEFQNLNIDNVVKLKKQFKNSKLQKEDLLEFASLNQNPKLDLVNKFNNFNLSVSGEELQKLGFKGISLGQEMEKREKENFANLLRTQ